MKVAIFFLCACTSIQLWAMVENRPKQKEENSILKNFKSLTINTKNIKPLKKLYAAAIDPKCTQSAHVYKKGNENTMLSVEFPDNDACGTVSVEGMINDDDAIIAMVFTDESTIVALTKKGFIVFFSIDNKCIYSFLEIHTCLPFDGNKTNRIFNDLTDIIEECVIRTITIQKKEIPQQSLNMVELCTLLEWKIFDPITNEKLNAEKIEKHFPQNIFIWKGKSPKNPNNSYARAKLLETLSSELENKKYAVSNNEPEPAIVSTPVHGEGNVLYQKKDLSIILHSQIGTITTLVVGQYCQEYKNNTPFYKPLYLSGGSNGSINMTIFNGNSPLIPIHYQHSKPIFSLRFYPDIQHEKDIIMIIFEDGTTETVIIPYEE